MTEFLGKIIFECKPGNMPEDIILDFDESIPFITGMTQSECEREFDLKHINFSYRKKTSKGYSWCGHHPRFWRELNDFEKRKFNRFINYLRRKF